MIPMSVLLQEVVKSAPRMSSYLWCLHFWKERMFVLLLNHDGVNGMMKRIVARDIAYRRSETSFLSGLRVMLLINLHLVVPRIEKRSRKTLKQNSQKTKYTMSKFYLFLALFFFLVGCKRSEKNIITVKTGEDSSVYTLNDNSIDSSIAVIQPIDTVIKKKPIDSLLSLNPDLISDPDTAIIIFLFQNHNDFRPDDYYEVYIRLDLEFDVILTLFKSIFAMEEDFDMMEENIKKQRELFIKKARKDLITEYQEYHGLSGMTFDFLIRRNDSIVKPMLYRAVNDTLVSDSEKRYSADLIFDLYADSTYLNRW